MAWAETAEISLRYELSGTGAKSLVLLHELGGSAESFDSLRPALERDFRLLRYDQRGAGQSEKPPRGFTLADHAEDLAAVTAAAGLAPPFHLVGLAAGAAIAVTFALAWPGLVAGLALCAPALTVAPDRRRYLAERSEAAARSGMRAIAEATLDRSYPEDLRTDRAVYESYRARFLGNDPVAYGHANRALADAELAARLGELAAPCLVIAGRRDLLRPPEATQEVARRIPGAAFAMIEGGHLLSVQRPDELARALRAFFLDGAKPPPLAKMG